MFVCQVCLIILYVKFVICVYMSSLLCVFVCQICCICLYVKFVMYVKFISCFCMFVMHVCTPTWKSVCRHQDIQSCCDMRVLAMMHQWTFGLFWSPPMCIKLVGVLPLASPWSPRTVCLGWNCALYSVFTFGFMFLYSY